MRLVDELRFDPVDNGSLHESWRQQPGTPGCGTDLPANERRALFSKLGIHRTKAQRRKFFPGHAKQEQDMALQGIKLK